MQEELTIVYRGRTVDDAQRVADRLSRAGIEAFVESTVSPMYGATVGPRGKIVRVRTPARSLAEEVVSDFERRDHHGLTEDEWDVEEEAGYEPSTVDKPSSEDPVQNFNVGNERLSDEGPHPEAPELAGTVDPDDPHRSPSDNKIVGYHPDRGAHADPKVERDEIAEKPIDDLDPDADATL